MIVEIFTRSFGKNIFKIANYVLENIFKFYQEIIDTERFWDKKKMFNWNKST